MNCDLAFLHRIMIFDLDFDLAYDRHFDKSHTTEECKVDSNG